MTTSPLMPKATAVWLVENTTLTFRQIAVFCDLHELEIQAIADGDVAYNIVGISPISNGQLALEEIEKCQKDKSANLIPLELERNVKIRNKKSKKVLSPSQRADKPSAVLWIIKNYAEIIDSQICKLVGTTKTTIEKIRHGQIRDAALLRPKNPITIGLCSERDIESALKISKSYNEPKEKKAPAKKVAVKKEKAPKKEVAKKEKASVKKVAVKKVAVKKEKAPKK